MMHRCGPQPASLALRCRPLRPGLHRSNNRDMRCLRNAWGSTAWRFAASQFAALVIMHCAALAATAPYGVDLDGHPVMLAQSTAPAIVLFFTASDCPISNC